MIPVALWTGRLPGLRPLPRKRTLWAVGAIAALGLAGALGTLGPQGHWTMVLASLVVPWAIWRHLWPFQVPRRLRSLESPQGPDERAVIVEIRRENDLLGWDVGILWFEKGGVGFVGHTVSFVVPRALMATTPPASVIQTIFRAPQMTAKVHETTVGIVPLGEEMRSQMTLARIDALPDASTSENILPPNTMHPDLLQRALTVRRRLPYIVTLLGGFYAVGTMPSSFTILDGLPQFAAWAGCLFLAIVVPLSGGLLPKSVRERLPK